MTPMMHALSLPTFLVGSMHALRRVTLISLSVVIEQVFYPIFPPARHPADDCVGNRNLVNVPPLQLGEEVFQVHGKLFVNGFRLGFGNEFLKTWIIPDWVPDGIDLQTRNGNELTGRGCDQLTKYFYRSISPARAGFNFG